MKKSIALAAVVIAVVAVGVLPLVAQNAGGPRPAGQAPPGAAQRPPTQGGTGPIRMLLITKAHPFDHEPFYQMFDSFGQDVTWMHVEHPAAEALMTPKYSNIYDVLVFYDMDGSQAELGRSTRVPVTPPNPALWPQGTKIQVNPPPDDLKKGFPALLQQGKGIVFLHHAIASWIHSWPEYVEVTGAACDWGNPINIRGVQHPISGFFGMTPQHISVVDKTHPITQGIGDGLDVIDEAYSCPMFEESVHPLLRTDFVPADHDRNLNPKWKYSNLAGWVKTAENSPIAYIEMGHGPATWTHPTYRKLVLNAIKWAASPEAMTWAKANPTKIFKSSTN
jgi:type 1 glutamine amidotransferase